MNKFKPSPAILISLFLHLTATTVNAAGVQVAPDAATGENAQPESNITPDPVKIQQARGTRITARGEKRHYEADRWSLDNIPAYKPRYQVNEKIRLWGLNYIATGHLAEYWEAAFKKFHPQASFEYFLPTALVAIPGLYLGEADLAPSRPITFDEVLAFQRVKGYQPLGIGFATGSFDVPGWAPTLVIVVHKDNPIRQLSMEQLDGIFGAERTGGFDETFAWRPDRARGPEKNIRTWGELGLEGEWADAPITPYGLTLKYHQQSRIEQRVFHGGTKWSEKLREYAHFTNPDGSTVVSNNQLLEDLSKDRFGIAYTNFGYITDVHAIHTVALSAASEDPAVEPSIDTSRDRSYPLFGEAFFYLDRAPGQPLEPKVEEFMRFVLSREGQQAVIDDGKYLPLTRELLLAELIKLD